MDENKTREILEGLEIPSEKIDELIGVLKEQEVNPIKPGTTIDGLTYDELREQMEHETDWRKRAAIAAKMISMELE